MQVGYYAYEKNFYYQVFFYKLVVELMQSAFVIKKLSQKPNVKKWNVTANDQEFCVKNLKFFDCLGEIITEKQTL